MSNAYSAREAPPGTNARVTAPEVEARARELLRELTLDEKLGMLTGDHDFYGDMVNEARRGERTLACGGRMPRLGLPGLTFTDGPRGVGHKTATCFPAASARAATFDYELEERIGEAIGREARARGANLVGAPCLNIPRHPAWGRVQETYGENPAHVAEMGAAMVRGLQKHVMACAKHFACNSTEESRFSVDVRASAEALGTVYLPQFERVVREGVAGVMAAYNSVNGEWCAQNRELLTTILKERWGFEGFVVTDWVFAVHDGVKALESGLDLEMPGRLFFNESVADAINRGEIPMDRVDDAVLRLIRQQLRFASVGDGVYGEDVAACAEHRALAREAATKAMVLLRNEEVDGRRVLPLAPPSVRRVAVIGRLASVANTGDRGSSDVHAPYVVTLLDGLRTALQACGVEVVHDIGEDLARAASLAAAADAAVVVVGYDYMDEGEGGGNTFPPPGFKELLPAPPPEIAEEVRRGLAEMQKYAGGMGGDRTSLTVHAHDEELILAVAAANPKTVVSLMCGGPVLMERWRHAVPAILVVWYPGMEGGNAFADILLGRKCPTGRLPFSIPTSEQHLPPFDRTASMLEYGPLHGQRLLESLGVPAAYPYGFGLSYDPQSISLT